MLVLRRHIRPIFGSTSFILSSIMFYKNAKLVLVCTKLSSLIPAEALIPANLNDLSEACLDKIKVFYTKFTKEDNIDMEVEKWKLLFNIPKEGCSALVACDPEYFPAIHHILVIFLTTPAGSVSCERSFSALRRLILWTRSTRTC